MVSDCEIELAEEFRPLGLAVHQELSGGEVFQFFVVHDDIYGRSRAFQVMMPAGECLKDHQKLLIVSVIVQLCSSKGAGCQVWVLWAQVQWRKQWRDGGELQRWTRGPSEIREWGINKNLA